MMCLKSELGQILGLIFLELLEKTKSLACVLTNFSKKCAKTRFFGGFKAKSAEFFSFAQEGGSTPPPVDPLQGGGVQTPLLT